MLALPLGPDQITDTYTVSTSDGTQFTIQLGINWSFDIEEKGDNSKIFHINDYVGFISNHLSAKVRSAIAKVNFEKFQKEHTELIQNAIFSLDEEGNGNSKLLLDENNLMINGIDIHTHTHTSLCIFSSQLA